MDDVSRLVEKVNYGGYSIERTRTTIHIVDPNGAHPSNGWKGETVQSYDYGPGWIGCSETGNVHNTSDPMATVRKIIDDLDVNGLPNIPDDANRCVVCNTPCEWHWCSNDCYFADCDTRD